MSVLKSNMENFTIYNSDQLNGMIQIFITTDGSVNFNELVKENQCFLVVDSLNPNTVKEVVDKVINILKSKNYNNINLNITVLTKNDVEKQQEEELKNISFQDDKFKVDVKNNELDNSLVKDEQQLNNIPKEQSDIINTFNAFLAAKMVKKVDNGIMKNYVTRTSDKYNKGYMLDSITPEEMLSYYNKMLTDEKVKQEISNLSPEEISNKVLDFMASEENKKKYYLETAEQNFNSTKSGVEGRQENAINDRVQQTGGLVNSEIGVGVNGPVGVSPTDSVVVAEQEGDHVKTGYASVTNTTINNDGVMVNDDSTRSDYQANTNDDQKNNDSEKASEEDLAEEEIQERDMLQHNMYNNTLNKTHVKTLVKRPSWMGTRGIASFAFLIFLTVISMAIGYIVFTITR